MFGGGKTIQMADVMAAGFGDRVGAALPDLGVSFLVSPPLLSGMQVLKINHTGDES